MTGTAFVCEADKDGSLNSHPLHIEWARQINADIVKIPTSRIPGKLSDSSLGDIVKIRNKINKEYENYIFEGIGNLYSLLFSKKIRETSKIILLDTTWRLEGSNAHDFTRHNKYMRNIYSIDREIDSKLLSTLVDIYVDGIITVSNMIAERDSTLFPETPIEIVNPSIDQETKNELNGCSPKHSSNKILFFSANRSHKGLNLLISSLDKVDSDVELHVAGKGFNSFEINRKNVSVVGFVENRRELFSSVSLSVHPALFDAFPVTTLETMYSGLPTVVTNKTGTKSIVDSVSSDYVCESSAESIARAIDVYMNKETEKREKEGRRFSQIMGDKESQSFREAFNNLLSSM